MRTYNLNRRYIKDLQKRAKRDDGIGSPKIKGKLLQTVIKPFPGSYWIDWDNPLDLDYLTQR